MTNRYSTTLAMLAFLLSPRADAAEILARKPVALPNVMVNPDSVTLNIAINAGNDAVKASYVTARSVGKNQFLQRTANGMWLPWDGRESSLINTHAAVNNGVIDYKIFADEQLAHPLFPITVTVAYRTPNGLKIGSFDVRVAR